MKEYDFNERKVLQLTLETMLEIFEKEINAITPQNQFLEHYSYYTIWIKSLISGLPFSKEAAMWFEKSTMAKSAALSLT